LAPLATFCVFFCQGKHGMVMNRRSSDGHDGSRSLYLRCHSALLCMTVHHPVGQASHGTLIATLPKALATMRRKGKALCFASPESVRVHTDILQMYLGHFLTRSFSPPPLPPPRLTVSTCTGEHVCRVSAWVRMYVLISRCSPPPQTHFHPLPHHSSFSF